MVQVREMLIETGRGRPGRKLSDPRGLVIHWSADIRRGADALASCRHFQTFRRYSVAMHYAVDSRQIIRCVPEDEVAVHVNSGNCRRGALRLFGTDPNLHALGIEWCVNADGDGAETYRNVVALAGDILARYDWDLGHVYRHYDVTGRICPPFLVDDRWARRMGFEQGAAAAWQQLRRDILLAARSAQIGAGLRALSP